MPGTRRNGAGGRLSPLDVRAAHAALLDDGRSGQGLRDLLCFQRLKKWTVPCFARYWDTSEDTARRALHALVHASVVACLQGRVRGRGGSERDIFFLTHLGARVLTRHLGGATSIEAPIVARDAAVATAGGLLKHKVPAKPGQDKHDVDCLRLATHHRWLHHAQAAPPWHLRESLAYPGSGGREQRLIPDFTRHTAEELEPDFARFMGYARVQYLSCLEVEGTTAPAHVWEKHTRYGAFSRALRREQGLACNLHLTIVFTFPTQGHGAAAGRATLKRMVRCHERAYGQQEDSWYGLSWTTLDRALALAPAVWLGEVETEVDYYKMREREKELAYWREARAARDDH
ncbi:MAG TPA: hypothetical protein VFW96_19950 [Thermomicrobiales bacterium]|nr:hypothetical protein [Thermomicrobiales bacterium]